MRSPLVAPLLAAALLAADVSAETPQAAAAAKFCGRTDIGYTSARVYGRNIACRRARRFVYRWARERRTNCTEENDFCKVTRRKGFRCVRGGSETVVELACRRRDQRIRALWGD